LTDLILDPMLQILIQVFELRGLVLHRVVKLFDSNQRLYSSKQLRLIDRLRQEIIRARFNSLDAFFAGIQSRDHHDRENFGRRITANSPADIVPTHFRHDDV
jgi:hypothetical protein